MAQTPKLHHPKALSHRPSTRLLRLDMAAGHATLLQILLVIVLGGEERHCGEDLGGYRLRVAMRFLQRLLGGLRGGLLFPRVKEDGGAVLCAPVRTLAVELRGVVVFPKN